MSTHQKSIELKIKISEPVYQWLVDEADRRAEDISSVVQATLERYVQQFDLTQTKTWQLRGAFIVAKPEAEYIIDSDETGAPITNYAENVDDILYKGN